MKPTNTRKWPVFIKRADGSFVGQVYKPKKYRYRLFLLDPECALCGKEIDSFEDTTLDHIIPRYHGGHTTRDNLQLAHLECNWRKGNKLPDGYRP